MRKALGWFFVTNHSTRRFGEHGDWETAQLKLRPRIDRNSAMADEVYS
jgi:hypothetical protein